MSDSSQLTPLQPFWHRPLEVESGARWHLYKGERGATFCGNYMLVGFGMPKDARYKAPNKGKCGKCFRRGR